MVFGFQNKNLDDKPLIEEGPAKIHNERAPQRMHSSNAWDPDSEQAFELGKIHSALGAGTEVNGKLKFDTPVRIDGRLSGEIISSKPVIIGPEGSVNAEIKAPIIVIYGKLEGGVTALERLEVRRGGSLIGTFSTPRLIVDDGALVDGSCSMKEARSKNITPVVNERLEEHPKDDSFIEEDADSAEIHAH
jgi:cytoskeletal protein CcmA (bactofilin family)